MGKCEVENLVASSNRDTETQPCMLKMVWTIWLKIRPPSDARTCWMSSWIFKDLVAEIGTLWCVDRSPMIGWDTTWALNAIAWARFFPFATEMLKSFGSHVGMVRISALGPQRAQKEAPYIPRYLSTSSRIELQHSICYYLPCASMNARTWVFYFFFSISFAFSEIHILLASKLIFPHRCSTVPGNPQAMRSLTIWFFTTFAGSSTRIPFSQCCVQVVTWRRFKRLA